uniref:Uncharacterized protein n=1 Tax=Arundo donax TaxID=35708 RepID=A0A0A9D147_ARUDO
MSFRESVAACDPFDRLTLGIWISLWSIVFSADCMSIKLFFTRLTTSGLIFSK